MELIRTVNLPFQWEISHYKSGIQTLFTREFVQLQYSISNSWISESRGRLLKHISEHISKTDSQE